MEIQWPLVIFGLFAGCGGATLTFVGLSNYLRIGEKARIPAVICTLILLIVGGCASVLHLGQPANIMAAAANIFSFSGISVELIMLGVNVVVCITYLIAARGDNEIAAKVVGTIAIFTGVILAFVVGNGYVMEAQTAWNTITLPIGYLGSGLGCGATLFMALMGSRGAREDEIKTIAPYVIGVLIVQTLAFIAYDVATGLVVDAPLFWAGAIAIGCVGSLACTWFSSKKPTAAWAAFACAIVGGICFRSAMWLVGSGYLDFFSTAATRTVIGV